MKKTLALQGGGCLGYGQVLVLSAGEKQAGQKCCELFGLIGGTSVGSIIGACLAVGVPAVEVEKFFTTEAPEIFNQSLWRKLMTLADPKYSAKRLETSLKAILGPMTLADCNTDFIATAYDWATDRPVYFKSYEASRQDKNSIVIGYDSDIELWQVCRASSAAQTYFPAYQVDRMTLLDGGNAGDNAPDTLVITEMLKHYSLDDFAMLSLGSGDTLWKERPKAMVSPSLLRAGLETIKIVFSAGEDAQIAKARRLLGDRHHRLSPDLGDGIAIDDARGCLTKIPPAVADMLQKSQTSLDAFFPKP
jgi:patatin-like phospholipase/acyl hydrolase